MRVALAGGFTLIEVLVTIAIAAVLMALAGTGLEHVWARRAVAARADGLVEALELARGEAMKRGSPVSVCALSRSGAAACDEDLRPAWRAWMVFAEATGPRHRPGRRDPDEPVLLVRQDESGPVADAGLVPAGLQAIRFEASGIARPLVAGRDDLAAGGSMQFHFVPRGAEGRASGVEASGQRVCLNAAGHVDRVEGAGGCP